MPRDWRRTPRPLDAAVRRRRGDRRADAAAAGSQVVMLSNSFRDDDKKRALQPGAAGSFVKVNLSLRQLALQVDQLVKQPGAN